MLKDKNHPVAFVPTLHKWTQEEKQANCSACVLAECMKTCKTGCPFYTPKDNTVSLMKGK